MSGSERYHHNCQIVYDIYGIPPKERGTRYNIHHNIFRSDVGNLVPRNFDIDNIANLTPLKVREEHDPLHRYITSIEGNTSSKHKKKDKKHKHRKYKH